MTKNDNRVGVVTPTYNSQADLYELLRHTPQDDVKSTLSPCERVEFQLEQERKLEIRERVKKAAFTLAEVLITLGIIGIVAAITIPGLITQHKIKVIQTKALKIKSVFSQAFKMAIEENSELSSWGLKNHDKASIELVATKINPYLKLLDDCGSGACSDYTGKWKLVNNASATTWNSDFHANYYYKMRLWDGTEIFLDSMGYYPYMNINSFAVSIKFDINGKQGPNMLGRDIFSYMVKEDGTVVTLMEGADPSSSGWEYCNPTKNGEGWACLAWILHKGNMDYLKCANKLKWNGPIRCP
ncbi:MAG: type II secretion system GspH family protein [Muribaculaceae bacterium]|nr:type II secretion system GspH family protein [Muribaculaceae bacterium]